MSRYGFNVNDFEIVVGWDNPCQTFFGQVYLNDEPVSDTMIGLGRFDIRDLRSLEADLGYKVPPEIGVKLIEDRDGAAPRTPLQKRVAGIFEGELR